MRKGVRAHGQKTDRYDAYWARSYSVTQQGRPEAALEFERSERPARQVAGGGDVNLANHGDQSCGDSENGRHVVPSSPGLWGRVMSYQRLNANPLAGVGKGLA